jgi:hypothetical protein
MSLLPRPRSLAVISAMLLAGAVVACNDPYRVRASLDVVEDTLVLHSISDLTAPATAPVVLDIANQANVFSASTRMPVARRLGPEFYANGAGFDVAIDVRGDSVIFVPPRKVATSLSTVRRVGIRRDTVAFESVAAAPGSGYAFDTVSVAARQGNTVFVVSQHPVCASEINSEIYAKIGIIAIDPVARTATLRVRLDPNCGFRSFLPGVPKR